jgi:tetratricopeptide (TPR) repeat protein
MKWSLSGAEVVGGNRPLDAKVPFAHARVVLQKQITEEGEGEEYLLVYRYPSPEEAEGDTMMRDEWEALIAAGEAHRLPTPLPAKRNGTLWILGAAFPKREQVVKELSDANALIESVEVTGDLLVCYVQEDSASIVRERQAKSATFHAWSATAKGKWDEAVSHAERALAIGGMSPERVAQLAFLYERQGRVSRSRGYLRMALDSRGQSFHEKTLEKFNSYSDRANPKGKVVVSSASEEQLAKKEFDRAWQLARHQEWDKALPHALRALEIDDMSPKHFALVMLLYEHERDEEQKNHYRRMAQEWRGPKFVEEMLKKHRDFSTLSERSEDSKTSFQPAYLIIFVALFLLTLPIILGGWAFPSKPEVSEIAENLDVNGLGVLLRKLSATILVYFMQFGFIAFEAGYVQQNFRKQSAIKNLIVFAISFISYIFLGWHIQRWIHPDAFSNLLDIAFNAGFASTVALIIANTITERGTLLVNTLCSMVAAGIAYPVLAGLLFPSEGLITTGWGFVDTAGGCVVHVLGGAFGLTAALWIGPRIKRRAWYILGKVQVEQRGDYIPFAVIGAFFLWFGWLGFNSGNATDWNRFLDAFRNTNIGASAGGLVGLIIAVANGAMLATRGSSDLTSGGLAREIRRDIANLERVHRQCCRRQAVGGPLRGYPWGQRSYRGLRLAASFQEAFR